MNINSLMGKCPCAMFGDFSFSRFGFNVRTDRQTNRQNHRGRSTLYSRGVSNELLELRSVHAWWSFSCLSTFSRIDCVVPLMLLLLLLEAMPSI